MKAEELFKQLGFEKEVFQTKQSTYIKYKKSKLELSGCNACSIYKLFLHMKRLVII